MADFDAAAWPKLAVRQRGLWLTGPEAAAWSAEAGGLSIFPCRLGQRDDKVTKVEALGLSTFGSWDEAASAEAGAIEAMWAGCDSSDPGRHLVGVHCGKSGIFVVDEDDPLALADEKGSRWAAVLDGCETLIRRSLSKGLRHWWFRQPAGSIVTSGTFHFGDVKGDGGYVVVSTAPLYRDRPMAEPPAALLDLLAGRLVERRKGWKAGGTGHTGAPVEPWDVEAALAELEAEIPVVVDDGGARWLAQIEERFWEHRRAGEHRREVVKAMIWLAFIEALAGSYRLTEAWRILWGTYRTARDEDSSWSSQREADFRQLWSGLVDRWRDGDPDLTARVEEKREELGLYTTGGVWAEVIRDIATGTGNGHAIETTATPVDVVNVTTNGHVEEAEAGRRGGCARAGSGRDRGATLPAIHGRGARRVRGRSRRGGADAAGAGAGRSAR